MKKRVAALEPLQLNFKDRKIKILAKFMNSLVKNFIVKTRNLKELSSSIMSSYKKALMIN